MTDVKICGIRTPDALQASITGGARYIGLVFTPHSPRFIAPEQAAVLARSVPTGMRIVGLFVDPDDEELSRITQRVPLDFIQLHGAESPHRVAHIRQHFGLPIIKAIPLATKDDLKHIEAYQSVSDWLLFDAKSSPSTASGGNGLAFDWQILKDVAIPRPWMLAGGLTPENVGDALDSLTPDVVDVSSGVESSKGIKSPEKILHFLRAVRSRV